MVHAISPLGRPKWSAHLTTRSTICWSTTPPEDALCSHLSLIQAWTEALAHEHRHGHSVNMRMSMMRNTSMKIFSIQFINLACKNPDERRIWWGKINKHNTIQCNTIQYDTMQYNAHIINTKNNTQAIRYLRKPSNATDTSLYTAMPIPWGGGVGWKPKFLF
jgi:hypothetical protein